MVPDQAPDIASTPPDLARRINRLGEALAAARRTIAEGVETRGVLTDLLREALLRQAATEADRRHQALRHHEGRKSALKTVARRLGPRASGRDANPGALFDLGHYLVQAPDLGPAQAAFTHYLQVGWTRGLSPHPLFDPEWYAAQARSEGPPLVHYLTVGWREGLSPHPLVDPAWCLERSPDLAQADVEPLTHYLTHGAAEGRDPGPWFGTARYVAQRGADLPPGRNPLVDYLQGGAWAVCAADDLIFAVGGMTPLERWARNAGPSRRG